MNLPADFIQYTRDLMGPELFERLVRGLEEEPQTSIRINPFKGPKASVAVGAEPVPWCKNGFYLTERPNFTFDPLLHGGLYYVQEASSMFLDHVLSTLVHEPVRMLDLCAAPGGKTTCAMSALPEGSALYSNEPMRNRAQILNENILKFGHPGIVVTNAFPKDYRKAGLTFDVILTDVPCSGEGMFRKDEGAIREWSPANVEKCWRLQREIVCTIWPCLRPGGLLIYSTCTFNAHEDEENVAWIASELGADFVEIPTEQDWNIVGSLVDNNPVYRFLPGVARGEGLFMAVLRKKEDPATGCSPEEGGGEIFEEAKETPSKRGKERSKKARFQKEQRGKKGKPAQSADQTGLIPLGDGQGEKLQGVLSLGDKSGDFPTAALSWRDAVSYLQGQSLVLDADTPKGFVAVTYEDVPIGLVKNLGNRANNLYPAPWRIRTTHLPDEEIKIIQL